MSPLPRSIIFPPGNLAVVLKKPALRHQWVLLFCLFTGKNLKRDKKLNEQFKSKKKKNHQASKKTKHIPPPKIPSMSRDLSVWLIDVNETFFPIPGHNRTISSMTTWNCSTSYRPSRLPLPRDRYRPRYKSSPVFTLGYTGRALHKLHTHLGKSICCKTKDFSKASVLGYFTHGTNTKSSVQIKVSSRIQ